MTKLIITNGDSAAELLREALDDPSVAILPWRDVLHFGPLTWTETLEEFSESRLDALSFLRGSREKIVQASKERDHLISRHRDFDQIEIWLEHDLYDQLQLVQIVNTLTRIEDRTEGITLVQADDFLGHQAPATVLRFADNLEPLTTDMAQSAQRIWRALTASTPQDIAELVQSDFHTPFPFITAALLRFLEELPGLDGLSRTQRSAVNALIDGPLSAGRIFGAVQDAEPAAFMGDTMLFQALDELIFSDEPAIRFVESNSMAACGNAPRAPVELTDFGHRVIADEDFLASNPIERWWGGTHLTSSNLWRWNHVARALTPPADDS